MFGCKSGVVARIRALFPDVTGWHCTAHRLKLAMSDMFKATGATDHFKILMNKLYLLYHNSNKNRMDLKECAESLDIQLCKIGRILNTRWVASSFRTVEALWYNYPALHKHFSEAAADSSRNSATRSTYAGLNAHISSHAFINNLGLMFDALQELLELSVELQKRECTIIDAHKSIVRQMRLTPCQMSLGDTVISQRAMQENCFQGVMLNAGKSSDRQTDRSEGIFQGYCRECRGTFIVYR